MRVAMTLTLMCLWGLAAQEFEANVDDLPSGVVNTQNPKDVSLTP